MGPEGERLIMTQTDQSHSQTEDQRYLKHRQQLYDLAIDQTNRFDRLIVTLSGGALALSITFINEIAPVPERGSTLWLALGWGALISSVLATLISHQTSQSDMFFEIRRLDELYKAGQEHDGSANFWNNCTRILNILSALLFVFGASLLAIYVYLNIA